MAISAGSRLGPYEVLSPLGAGGMGEVYRARDTRLGRDVAVKVVHPRLASDPDRLSRFEKEARAAAQVDHPNILVVHDIGEHEGSPYIVSELLQGESLREKLGAPLPPKKAVDYATQIARGLAAAHEKGIVHRDIKPENVFVTKDGHVKILDFGVAKLLPSFEASGVDTQTPTEIATSPGTALGTVFYMSPEQIRSQSVDARSDLFSLGIVLYEMLSGRRPFQRGTVADTMSAILREEPPVLTGAGQSIPPVLDRIVRHCLEKDSSVRMQSAREVIFALETLSTLSGEAPEETTARRVETGAWYRRHRTALAGVALLVAAIAGGGLWWRSRSVRPVAGGLPSILALPCKVYGAPEAEYLTDAIPGTVSTLLAGVAGLDTKVPPTSLDVERLKGDIPKLADAYRAENLLLTTVTVQGDRFILNAQLVEARTRKVRWGKQFEGPRSDFNSLARQAAEGIRQAVSPSVVPVPTSPASSEVELAFQEGKYLARRYNVSHQPADFDAALRAFTRAYEPDHSFARALAETARLHFFKFEISAEGDKPQELRQVESWGRRALDVDPHCGEAWDALSWFANYSNDAEHEVEYSLKAVRYAPRDALAHVGLSVAIRNPGSELLALGAGQRARDLDPLRSVGVGFFLLNLGRPQEGLRVIDQVLRLEPNWKSGLVNRGGVLVKLGRFKEAAEALERSEPPPTEVEQYERWRLVRLALALAENDGAAVKRFEGPLFDLVSGKRSDVCAMCYVSEAMYRVAPGLAHAGRKDDVLRIFMSSIELGIAPSYDWLVSEPDIQLLRGDPRFATVLAASRDAALTIVRQLERARAQGELPAYFEEPLAAFLKLLTEKEAKS